MKTFFLLLAGLLLLATTGCEQAQQTKEAYSTLSKLSEAGKTIEADLETSKNRRAERVKSGDTLSLPYKELQDYLPAEVSGYTAAAPSGESMTTAGMSFSTAERKFTKDTLEVTVKITDYNGANQLYQGLGASLALHFESENDETLTKTAALKLDGVKGTETFHKKTGDAELTLAAGDRFLVTLNGTKQKDLALLESIAERMDLEKMARR
ncbi:MAG: hypothetical protein H7Z21_01630 [Hymenobacter sp.]|nr:hypothetical protein [Hymenobacter sp.]